MATEVIHSCAGVEQLCLVRFAQSYVQFRLFVFLFYFFVCTIVVYPFFIYKIIRIEQFRLFIFLCVSLLLKYPFFICKIIWIETSDLTR